MAARARTRAVGPRASDVALASPPVAVAATNVGGANQAGVRLYNERLLLSLVRRFGPLSKIEVARLTGTFGAIDLGDHEPAAGRRAVEAGGSAARPRRATDDPDVARSRRRVFVRAQDRAAQLRPGADRLPRRGSRSALTAPTPFRRRS